MPSPSFPGRGGRALALVLLAAAPLAGQTPGAAVPDAVLAYPNLVLYGGKVITVDDAFTMAEAVAVRDGRILAVGTRRRSSA